MIKSSNNLLNLIVHRETKCLLFEISTELAGVNIKTKIKKRNGFCTRLNAKFKFFPVIILLQKKIRWQTEPSLMTLL